MADAAGAADNEDYAFDSFADPGGLIMSSIIEKHLQEAPNKQRLFERARALKLPGNPLVSTIPDSQLAKARDSACSRGRHNRIASTACTPELCSERPVSEDAWQSVGQLYLSLSVFH